MKQPYKTPYKIVLPLSDFVRALFSKKYERVHIVEKPLDVATVNNFCSPENFDRRRLDSVGKS